MPKFSPIPIGDPIEENWESWAMCTPTGTESSVDLNLLVSLDFWMILPIPINDFLSGIGCSCDLAVKGFKAQLRGPEFGTQN